MAMTTLSLFWGSLRTGFISSALVRLGGSFFLFDDSQTPVWIRIYRYLYK